MEEGNKRYAVLVGCNYPGMAEHLDGSVTDVLKMRQLLVSRFGFLPNNIAILVDADIPESYVTEMDVPRILPQSEIELDHTDFVRPGPPMRPTGRNIKDKLRFMIQRAEPGDVLFFHFSGHGTQVPSMNGGTKTAIVPTDLNIIADVDFRQIVNRMARGASFTYLSDSCKTAGDIIDKMQEQLGAPPPPAAGRREPNANTRSRGIPYATIFNYLNAKSQVESTNISYHLVDIFGVDASSSWRIPEMNPYAISLPTIDKPAVDQFAHPLPEEIGILLSGSLPDGISVDVDINIEEGRVEGYGLFSNVLLNILQQHPGRITNKELLNLARAGMDDMQYPCLYCSGENAEATFLYQQED